MSARLISAAVALAMFSSCAHMQSDTRIEKGPVLRTFERERVEPNAGVQATVEARWPTLDLSFFEVDRCRKEKVEETLEERITETSQPGTGPSVTLGLTTSVVGAALLLGQGLFPDSPNPRLIDASGRYPATSRQLARGWGIGLLIVGVPALAVGGWGLTQNGEHSESRKVESVASSTEAACHARPLTGQLAFAGGKSPPRQPENGRVTLDADFLRSVDLSGLTLNEHTVTMEDEDQAQLDAFRACLAVLPVAAPEAISALSTAALRVQLEQAQACRAIRQAPIAGVVEAYERELATRSPPLRPTNVGKAIESFDEAKARLEPKRAYSPESKNLAELDDAERIAGESVVLRGIVGAKIDEDIVAFDVGTERVWLLLEKQAPWLADVSEGSRLEVLGVVMGRDARPDKGSAPLIRTMWARPAL